MNCLLLFSPAKLKLAAAKDFHYLNQSGCIQVPKINDEEDFEKIRVLTLSFSTTFEAFSHLSNVIRLP